MKQEKQIIRLCVDCQHFGRSPGTQGTCRRPAGKPALNLVYGGPKYSQPSNEWCELERTPRLRLLAMTESPFNRCGPEAKFFEPKNTAEAKP